MKKYLYSMFQETGSLSVEEILLHILIACLLGVVIYTSYYFTHAGGGIFKKIQCLSGNADRTDRNGYDGYRQQHCIITRYGRCALYR